MPAEIVSLNQFRKAKKKAQKEQQKTANRSKFGRNKGEKQRDTEHVARQDNDLDAKRMDNSFIDDDLV
ncbi:MAG: DUF4169 family protein [Rhodospirillaceae bacterium]|nr:DUF4169 family protein [Rhodospirillaceae bacterium]